MALHEQSAGASNEWYTPKYIFTALGCIFDMDVASLGKKITPWIPARRNFTKTDNGLKQQWIGFVWMNPPFGARNGLIPWLDKFKKHNNGIALVPDRTSAPWWQEFVPQSKLVMFVSKKIKFLNAAGEEGKSPAQGTCLYALGAEGCSALHCAAERNLGTLFTPAKVTLS